ncbi:hypothetical protein [Actinomyces ruminis]|uniref:hypothetical protein n=1 Tax=Actinomyces ruminis TaxID=1937003 RepID=UPI0015D4C949|nr:hypothetical protein [Actinomyces ruminis]
MSQSPSSSDPGQPQSAGYWAPPNAVPQYPNSGNGQAAGAGYGQQQGAYGAAP